MVAKRHLKEKEAKQIVREFVAKYAAARQTLDTAGHLQELVADDGSIIFVDELPLIIRRSGAWIPSLKFGVVLDTLPKVVVDMGAVPHVVNGAQIMRPGIREIVDTFKKDDLVVVQDERFRKAIAIGTADMDSDGMKVLVKGKVITNLHYVGDIFWTAFATPG